MATIATEVVNTALLQMREHQAVEVDSAGSEWKRRRGTEALNSLTPLERAAIILSRRDGLTCDDIAERTGHSSDEVRAALASGLTVCVKYLSG